MKTLTLLSLATILVAGMALANPIPVRNGPRPLSDFPPVTWAWIFAIALVAEFLFVLVAIRKVKPFNIGRFAVSFVVMHALTFPVTLLLSQSLHVAAEAFPLLFEPWLLSRLGGLPLMRIWLAVVLANLGSFLLGLLLAYAASQLASPFIT